MKNIGWPMRSWFIKAQSSSVVPLVPGGARMYCWRRLRRGDSKPDRPIRKVARSVESNTLSAAVMLPLNLSVNCRRGTRLGRLAYWRLCKAALKADCAGTVPSSKSYLFIVILSLVEGSHLLTPSVCLFDIGVVCFYNMTGIRPIIINDHQSSSIIINDLQSSSMIINHHQSSSMIMPPS